MVLEAGEQPGGSEAEPEQQHTAAVQDEPQGPAPYTGYALRREQERTVSDVSTDGEEGVVGTLTGPHGEYLAQRQPAHPPPQRPNGPPRTLDRQLRAQDSQREPRHNAGIRGTTQVAPVHETVELVSHRRQQ